MVLTVTSVTVSQLKETGYLETAGEIPDDATVSSVSPYAWIMLLFSLHQVKQLSLMRQLLKY